MVGLQAPDMGAVKKRVGGFFSLVSTAGVGSAGAWELKEKSSGEIVVEVSLHL